MARVVRVKKKPGPAKGVDPHKRRDPADRDAERESARKARRRCEGLNKRGEPCGAIPFKNGSVIDGVRVSGRWCRRHSVEHGELPTEADLDTKRDEAWENGALKGRKPRKTDPMGLVKELVEANPIAFMRPYLKALGLEVTIDGDGNVESVRQVGPGAKLYSTSDGYVYVSAHEDVEAQQRAAERLFDRGFGKPVQTNLLGGAAGAGPIEVDVPTTADRVREVAEVLRELGLDD